MYQNKQLNRNCIGIGVVEKNRWKKLNNTVGG